MIPAGPFLEQVRARGAGLFSGVPCSYLQPLINYVIDEPEIHYLAAANEGDAIAIGAGAQLAGTTAVVMFQNSGLGNAVNPLTSLTQPFRIPLLLIVTLRGDPDDAPDEPQHRLMGSITTRLLETMEIPWSWFPQADSDVARVLDAAFEYLRTASRPYALVMRKGSVAPWPLSSPPTSRSPPVVSGTPPSDARASRRQMLAAILAASRDEDAIVATTGYTGRELYALADRPAHFYMVGSMGCALSLGLGIATIRADRRVLVLDGDGALLMRLGSLATTGYYRPSNLIHVLLDNGAHESTGGQKTVSPAVDFCALARACGYPRVASADDPAALSEAVGRNGDGPSFVRAAIRPGVPDELPRPRIAPEQLAQRFRSHLEKTHAPSAA